MIKSYKLLALLMIVTTLVAACGRAETSTPKLLPTLQATQSQNPDNSVQLTQPSLSQLSGGLVGLDFDGFVEASFERLLSRDP
jgi:ABC-type phosphate/phosphonate transport system substrate-binding protein